MALIADYLERLIVNTILVAVDGSPSSVQAARAAVGFAHDHVSKLIVLAFSERAEGAAVTEPAMHDDARDCAYQIGEYALKARIPCEMDVLHSESPAEEIVAASRHRHCDLIWMPAASDKGRPYPFGAAVATEVLGKADVPVMLFRSRTVA